MYTVLSIIIAVISVILVVVICLQQSNSSGLSGSLAGSSETYWAKNKSRSKEGKLKRITVIAGIVFFVLAILLNVGAIVR